MSLRTKILIAILGSVLVTVLLATWVVGDRLQDGATRETYRQGRARGALTSALYRERAATLVANAEAVALYPAVIAAVDGHNAQPLVQWSQDVAAQQQIHVKVFDATGAALAHGHAADRLGPLWDDLQPGDRLEGVDLALAGQPSSGVETSDEIGLAIRGYAPVRRDGATGPVVGAVMLADPLDASLLERLAGGNGSGVELRLLPYADDATERCEPVDGAVAVVCQFRVLSPRGQPMALFSLTAPLTDVEDAYDDAQHALWLTGALLLGAGAVAAWLLARSLTAPLASPHGCREAHRRRRLQSADQPALRPRDHDGQSGERDRAARAGVRHDAGARRHGGCRAPGPA